MPLARKDVFLPQTLNTFINSICTVQQLQLDSNVDSIDRQFDVYEFL